MERTEYALEKTYSYPSWASQLSPSPELLRSGWASWFRFAKLKLRSKNIYRALCWFLTFYILIYRSHVGRDMEHMCMIFKESEKEFCRFRWISMNEYNIRESHIQYLSTLIKYWINATADSRVSNMLAIWVVLLSCQTQTRTSILSDWHQLTEIRN